MKKLLSLLFAGVLVLSLAGTVLAQADGSAKGKSSVNHPESKKKKKKHKKKPSWELTNVSGTAKTVGSSRYS